MLKNAKKAISGPAGGQGAEQSNSSELAGQGNNQVAASTAGQEQFSNQVASQTSTEQVSQTELPGAEGELATGQVPQAEVSGAATGLAEDQKPAGGYIAYAVMAGIHAVKVSAPHDGYRRAGRAWLKSATHVPLDELTDAQLRHLTEDSRLIVTPVRGLHAKDIE